MTFCTDIDLLYWEPNLFRDAAFASQTLLSGTGDLAGSTFTIDAGSLTAAHIVGNLVITLTGTIAGCYPIISVNSATQLTLGVLHDAMFPDGATPTASPVGTANDLSFSIRTFSPQIRVVSDMLKQATGLVPGSVLEEEADILNPEVLRKACVPGALQMIYSALGAMAEEPATLNARAAFYERLYRRALRNARVELDIDGDGQADTVRLLNVVDLVRA